MRTAPQAIAHLNAQQHNQVGYCQRNTWQAYDAHAVGDVDGDGDADAVDGWLSESVKHRHLNKRPDIGGVGSWSGGSNGNGHRAVCSRYDGATPIFRSTDGNGPGNMGDRPLEWFEREWGVHWLGWTSSISGLPIEGLKPAPGSSPHKEEPVVTRGPKIDHAIVDLKTSKAKPGTPRAKAISNALKALHAIPPLKRKK